MHVFSGHLHYFVVSPNIIWLPYLSPLINRKIRYKIHHLHPRLFHMVKRLRKSVKYIRRYSTKYASLLTVSYQTFTNELYQLWSYWTKVHEIFTRYRGIIYAVDAHIQVAISHSVLECQSNGREDFAIFTN